MGEHLRIFLGCLVPTVFDVAVTCQAQSCEFKWGICEVDEVKTSVLRQLDAACDDWDRETCGKVQIDYELRVTDQPVEVVKKCRVKKPPVAELIGHTLYREATCFMVWVPLPSCTFSALGKQRPYTQPHSDCMWIPTTEESALADLRANDPRNAARHELKHWVKNRMEDIGVCTIPSPDKDKEKQYWPKLREALTAENIAKLNETISERLMKRRESASHSDETGGRSSAGVR